MVEVLPFDSTLGYPQRRRVKISGTAYDLFWRWNYDSEYTTLKIDEVETGSVLFVGKLCEKFRYLIRSADTLEIRFIMLPWTITSEKPEVWVFYD